MVMALHYDKLVRGDALVGDIPRLSRPADADAFALADRIEGEPDVLADGFAFLVDDLPWNLREVSVQEFAERALADEADAGRVLLGMVRQSGLERDAPHFGFLQLAHRKHHARELLLRETVEEVALVFRRILAPEKPYPIGPGVMAGHDLVGAQAHGVVEEGAELDLGVAQHVGV